jgi:hypothetical protein
MISEMDKGIGRMLTMKKKKQLQETEEQTEKSHREGHLESICHRIMEFQRTQCYDLMHRETKEWKEYHGI